MLLTRRSVTLGTVAGAAAAALVPEARAAEAPGTDGCSSESPQVVLDWERIVFRTVYVDTATPIPVGVPVLGFVSVAMHRAATRSAHVGASSETAAVATAAHDVLVHYYPGSAAPLAADLATSLAGTNPTRRAKGARIGARAAADLLASRVGDHYLDPSIHYGKTAGPGVWQPNPPAADMLAPWLGSLRPLFLSTPVPVAGPFALASAAYAAEYDEVRRLGGASSLERTAAQTATAQFFNSNSATMVSDALIRYLEAHPIGLLATARMFAMIHGAMTDSAIRVWGLKRDVGFWRPSQAIAGADADGNPDTAIEAGWTPLVPNPNYSDYVSGHAGLTGPAVEIIRRTLGEDTRLELRSVNSATPRTYAHLSELEFDAFHARIWSGLHYRRAMVDGYDIAHRTAERVMSVFGA
ncbi:MAG: hypothetical protein QOH37_1556 [Nocardioidaceae bacterium]|nr:hypothetical protein [Nocardioidaceae bacterium]